MENNAKITSMGSATLSSHTPKKEKSVFDILTETFVNELAHGNIPWEKPWISISSGSRYGGWSHDEKSKGKPYSLLNQMLLPKEGEYITWDAVQREGGRVKKGAKSLPIFFFKPYQIEVENKETHKKEEKTIPVLRYYRVFHIDDTEGIEQRYFKDENPMDSLKEPSKCKKADEIVKAYIDREGVTLTHKAGDEAYYSPLTDSITLPLKKQFDGKKAEYYSTLFHELTHSTGCESRLNRFKDDCHSAKKDYSLEELVAEIGASAMLRNLGLETQESHKNNTAYIKSWIKALENDTKMITKASGRAEKAIKFICED